MQRSSKEVLRQQRNHMFQIPARPDMLLLIPVGGSSQAGQSPIPGLSLGISLPSNSPRCRRKSEARCWTDRIPFANRVECALSFLSPGSSGSRLGRGLLCWVERHRAACVGLQVQTAPPTGLAPEGMEQCPAEGWRPGLARSLAGRVWVRGSHGNR